MFPPEPHWKVEIEYQINHVTFIETVLVCAEHPYHAWQTVQRNIKRTKPRISWLRLRGYMQLGSQP